MVVAAIVLDFFLIFIRQNSDQVQVQYLGWERALSLGVAMMFAALAGALTIGLLGTVRILRLRPGRSEPAADSIRPKRTVIRRTDPGCRGESTAAPLAP